MSLATFLSSLTTKQQKYLCRFNSIHHWYTVVLDLFLLISTNLPHSCDNTMSSTSSFCSHFTDEVPGHWAPLGIRHPYGAPGTTGQSLPGNGHLQAPASTGHHWVFSNPTGHQTPVGSGQHHAPLDTSRQRAPPGPGHYWGPDILTGYQAP